MLGEGLEAIVWILTMCHLVDPGHLDACLVLSLKDLGMVGCGP